ncbi:MAG: cysteine--tRNA ligase [Pseudohongiellaceae bacterium]|uniref:Cysteine--tRNA ligase n=1 Tax=OM182 bacterium MED-G28 TaxID=1986256 RepID=A0A2A5WGD2_9GAMM|nr:MAG: cysteine--tRNA ligase [OM182 bacterium MED-G28]
MLQIYNTMTQTKEEFCPIDEGKVRIYVCGLTVYDYTHLGHGRMLVAFDVIVRYLRAKGLDVTYVRNITDIDDKILNRAAENNELFSDLTERFIESMHADEKALNVLPPDQEPRATGHIDQIISMIEVLLKKEFAYRAENGDVYFSIKRFPDYGKLSKKKMDELLEGARIEVGELKVDPRDFVLWKSSPDDGVGWDSPWGYGRPGWHIECSAMSTSALGNNFDIHGGGTDLLFPHHENEIAQSECATGSKFANYWMHNGPLRVDSEKMSKSLGNFFTVREVLKKYDAEVVRHLLIASHYRSPINYSEQSLQQSAKALERFYIALQDLDLLNAKTLVNSKFEKAFFSAMDDDFNTAEAFGVLFEIVTEINRQKGENSELANQLGKLLVSLGEILGILQAVPDDFLRSDQSFEIDETTIDQLIAEREKARLDKNWGRADEIRDQLLAMKVVVEDDVGGSNWRIDR